MRIEKDSITGWRGISKRDQFLLDTKKVSVSLNARPSSSAFKDCRTRVADHFAPGSAHGILGGMKQKVYIETSVVSYLTNRRSRDMVIAAHRNQIEALVEEAGYACPVICTPEELMED